MGKYNDRQFARRINKGKLGRLLDSSLMYEIAYDDEFVIRGREKIDANIVNTAINSLTKYILTSLPEEAFKRCILGAKVYCYKGLRNKEKYKEILNALTLIKGNDANSIYVACNLAQFEKFYYHTPTILDRVKEIKINDRDLSKIGMMISRNIRYFKDVGPVVKVNYNFKDYLPSPIKEASADIITRNGLYEVTTSFKVPTDELRAMLIMHYIMFKHSKLTKNLDITTIGIFNPRLHKSFVMYTSDISKNIIAKFEEMLGY